MKGEKCQCQNIKNGDIIVVKEKVKGTACAYCGRMLFPLNWDKVPFYRKIIRWWKYRKN